VAIKLKQKTLDFIKDFNHTAPPLLSDSADKDRALYDYFLLSRRVAT
jgi:hypothetical protein